MDLYAKLSIRKAIQDNLMLAKQLHLNMKSEAFRQALNEFAGIAGLSEVFIEQNISKIRSWI